MLIVSKASAGSGKTFALALVYINFLLQSMRKNHIFDPYRHVLAVTFTKKATGEMKERIIHELYTLATNPSESGYTDYLLGVKRLEDEGKTTHRSLTAEQRAKEIKVLSDDCRTLLGNLLQDYPNFQVSTIDSFFQQILRSFAQDMQLANNYSISLDSKQVISEGVDQLFFDINDDESDLDATFSSLLTYATTNIDEGHNWNPKSQLRDFAEELLAENVQRQKKAFEHILQNPTIIASVRKQLSDIKKSIEQEYTLTKAKTISKKAPQDIQQLHTSATLAMEHLNDLALLAAVEKKVDERNRKEGRIPLAETNSILNNIINGAEAPFVYEKIGTRLQHFLIDEFQDTSRLQWENFKPLIKESCANGNDNLVVGDVKQSIYRWRGTDMSTLQFIDKEGLALGEELPKTYNFRTSEVIVNANNIMFERYAQYLSSGEKPISALAANLYANLKQEPTKKGLSGRFRIEWYDSTPGDLFIPAQNRTIEIIRSLQEEGRVKHLSEIAILVRYNKETAQLSQALIANGISVQSPEGLLIGSHEATQCVIGLLKIAINHDDKIAETNVKELLEKTGREYNPSVTTSAMFSNDLFALVRFYIDYYRLFELPNADAYITSLLDVVYNYSLNKNADVVGFLEYWGRNHDKLSIPASEAPEAVQIMTIHKAKGLEFPVVIIPFLSWPMGPKSDISDTLLWCDTEGLPEPFSQLPLIPISAKKAADNTYFSSYYQREIEMQYIDNLNLCYVAFTRPVHTLYAIAPQKKNVRNGESVGMLLLNLMQDHIKKASQDDNEAADNESNGTEYLVWEEDNNLPLPVAKEYKEEAERQVKYISVPENGRLRQRTKASEYNENTTFGNTMHYLLSQIENNNDILRIDELIESAVRKGQIKEEERETIADDLKQFFTLIQESGHSDWYSDRYTILNEQNILCGSTTYRPDRVMIEEEKAIIIDYKFGKENPAYNKQVQQYMDLLSEMGYQVEGWLVYFDALLHQVNVRRVD